MAEESEAVEIDRLDRRWWRWRLSKRFAHGFDEVEMEDGRVDGSDREFAGAEGGNTGNEGNGRDVVGGGRRRRGWNGRDGWRFGRGDGSIDGRRVSVGFLSRSWGGGLDDGSEGGYQSSQNVSVLLSSSLGDYPSNPSAEILDNVGLTGEEDEPSF
jgi:hypothetical protein